MVADHSEHTAANYFMHSGSGLQGRPSLGAWATYGLGSLSRNLPGYVVLDTGMIPPGGLDIFGNGAPVNTSSIARNASVSLVVVVTVSPSATAAQTVTVQLGDAGGGSPYDEQVSDSSIHEVRTNSTGILPAPVNGESEARGTLNATVAGDALLRVMLSPSSAGPLGYSADITYTTNLENLGSAAAGTVSLSGNAGVYIVATIPGDTKLKAGQSWPAGTLFTADALTTPNLTASYSGTQPAAATVTLNPALDSVLAG